MNINKEKLRQEPCEFCDISLGEMFTTDEDNKGYYLKIDRDNAFDMEYDVVEVFARNSLVIPIHHEIILYP